MRPMIRVLTTSPAPFVIALSATHNGAPFILLNWSLAVRTLMSSHLKCPAFVHFVLRLFATQAFMPGYLALKTHISVALMAS